MLLADLVATSAAVAATRSRLAKIAALADCLRRAEPGEVAIVVSYLSGELRQRRTGVGWAALRDLPAAAGAPSLEVGEVDRAFATIEAAGGAGSAAVRREALAALFARATAEEQRFLAMLAGGELRQGALAGIVTDAVAAAAEVDAAAVRRAAMLAGDLPAVAEAALASGAAGLDAFHLQVGRPVQPMLAKTAPSLEAALATTGEAAIEWKLDGVRIQVHRDGDDVAVFTRTLDPVTGRMPEIVEAVRALPLRTVILDGEAIALRPDGRPRPFQETASRAASRGRSRDAARGGAAHAVLLRRPASRRPRPPRPARKRATGRDRAAHAGRRLGAAHRHGGRRRGAGVLRRRARPRARGRRRQGALGSRTRPAAVAPAGSRSSPCTRSTSSSSRPNGATGGDRVCSRTSTSGRAIPRRTAS